MFRPALIDGCISVRVLCFCRSTDEMLLDGLGGLDCFGEKGWEITESRPRP